MNEALLQYVWQYRLFLPIDLQTTDGEKIEIIDPGKLNMDSGPDFFNAKIKIANTLWAGNVEIHYRSSDWSKHDHDGDPAYESVILHVVSLADTCVYRSDGAPIPQLELKYPEHIDVTYQQLLTEQKWIPCADRLSGIPPVFIQQWKYALLSERMEQKMTQIVSLLDAGMQHWEEAFYVVLVRNFGFGINGAAFEQLARSIPLPALSKHKDQLVQLEAMLFGQSGLLVEPFDAYTEVLNREYRVLQTKFNLQPIDAVLWKMLRLRPDNFPHVRIAQLAALIHEARKLFSNILEASELEFVRNLFQPEISDYWKCHYRFSEETKVKPKHLGVQSVNNILINTVVPFLFAYGQLKGKPELKEKAIDWLEQIPAEDNVIVRNWRNLGVDVQSAYDTQALLQLKRHYCEDKKCLRCRIGHKVLTIDHSV